MYNYRQNSAMPFRGNSLKRSTQQFDEKNYGNYYENRNKQRRIDGNNTGRRRNNSMAIPLEKLEGKICMCWFNDEYQRVVVDFVPRNFEDINDLQVKVKFENPKSRKMAPCRFYFDPKKKCAYSDSSCQFSHGEWVYYNDLQEADMMDCNNDSNQHSGQNVPTGRKPSGGDMPAKQLVVNRKHTDEVKNTDKHSDLIGKRCRVPFPNHLGQTTHYEAEILCTSNDDDMDALKVKVKFPQPTHQAMIPCRFYFSSNKECAFSDEDCKFSHGEWVSYSELEFIDEDSNKDTAEVKSAEFNVWKKQTKVTITDDIFNVDTTDVSTDSVTTDSEKLKSLLGKKYRAPYKYQREKLSYHIAMICSVPPEVPLDSDLEVKVVYMHPLYTEMRPCPFYFDPRKSCAFNNKKCIYSHGEIVPYASLQSYPDEPETIDQGKVKTKVLAKRSDNLWNQGVLDQVDEKECVVEFLGDKSRIFKTVPIDHVIPFHELGFAEVEKEGVPMPEKFKYLEDQKCRALFKHPRGDLRYHNAVICNVDEDVTKKTTLHQLQVKVRFLNPTNHDMAPCPYYFDVDKECSFTRETCIHSHGEWVPFFSVQDYIEANRANLRKGSKVLAKLETNNLWHRGEIEELPNGTEDKYLVRIQTQQHYIYKQIESENLMPLELPEYQEFNLELLNTSVS